MTDSQVKSQPPLSAKNAVNNEIDLLDYLGVIWRYGWMILLLCVVVMALTVVTSLRKPRCYQSGVVIVPPLDILQQQSGGGGLGMLANPLLRQVMNTTATSIAGMYVEILQSREVADSIVDRFRLMETYENTQYRSSARKQLKANTTISTTLGGAVKITVTDRDPNRSAAIANAYVEELDRRNKKLSTGQATGKRVFLENGLKEVEGKLSKIDNILSREAKTQEMLYELLVQQYELAKIEEARSMPTIQVLDPAVVPELPIGRGTVKKGMTAGVIAVILGVFLAFAAECIIQIRRRQKAGIGTATGGIRI